MDKQTKGQMPLDLEIPEKIAKRNENYYLSEEIITYITNEANKRNISRPVLLTAIINFYRTHGEGV